MPACAFAEACVGIGLFVSGVLLVVVSSALYANQVAGIGSIVLLAFLGATAGDHAGYYFGRWIGPRFHHLALVQRHRVRIGRAEQLVVQYGAWAIFIGRFLPAIRSLLPAMLGVSGFEQLRYSMLDLAACLLWALALGAIVTGIVVLWQ